MLVEADPKDHSEAETYFLYGRKSYSEALEYVGMVPGSELESSAGAEEDWVELIAFPKAAVIRVIPRAKDDE